MDYGTFIDWLRDFGPLGFCGLALAEKLIPFFPSYALMITLGLAAPDNHALVIAILATTPGSLIGTSLWYMLGRALGAHRADILAQGLCRFTRLGPHLYPRLTEAYRRNHFTVSLTGQLIPTIRICLALPAGAIRLDARAFLLASAIGCLIWNAAFLTLGHLLAAST